MREAVYLFGACRIVAIRILSAFDQCPKTLGKRLQILDAPRTNESQAFGNFMVSGKSIRQMGQL